MRDNILVLTSARHSPAAETAPKDQGVGNGGWSRGKCVPDPERCGRRSPGYRPPIPGLVFSGCCRASFKGQEGRNTDCYQKFVLAASNQRNKFVCPVGVVPQRSGNETAMRSYTQLFKVGTSPYKGEDYFFPLLRFLRANV